MSEPDAYNFDFWDHFQNHLPLTPPARRTKSVRPLQPKYRRGVAPPPRFALEKSRVSDRDAVDNRRCCNNPSVRRTNSPPGTNADGARRAMV